MTAMEFKVTERGNFTLVEFELPGPIEPRELATLCVPGVDPRKGVVLSGRGPVWLYCRLAHSYHFVKWVATHDPRLGGAVVVMSHDVLRKVGDVVSL